MTVETKRMTDRAAQILNAIRDLPSDAATAHAMTAIGVGLLRAEGVTSDAVRRLVDETLKGGDAARES